MRAASVNHVVGPADGLDVYVDVETPEQIAFSYTVAGVGSRAAAALIDYLICIGSLILVFLAMILVPHSAVPGCRSCVERRRPSAGSSRSS